jgi:outer membrane protein OmpA-like peptidoglycan-associated protein
MAFNLDKNEGAKPTTKFDLSKSDAPSGTVVEPGKSRSRAWLFVVPALLIAGIAAWYLSSNRNANKENDTATIATDSTRATIAPASQAEVTALADTQAAIKKQDAESSADAATTSNNSNNSSAATASSLNNKVPATFPKGSDAISNLDRSLVKDIVAFLEKDPAAVITVNGYASSEGELAFNQQISRSRADAFKSYLVSKGIPAARINATGKGIDSPVSSNDTEEGRVKNRRVEILLR